MGMVASDLVDYMSSQGLGTVATNLWDGEIPEGQTGLGVRETGGIFPEHTFSEGPTGIGTPVARVERPRVQVLARFAVYATARAKMQDAFNVLDGLRARTINGTLYQWVSAVQSPFDMGRNANQQSEWACNFDVVKAVSTSTTT